MLCVKKTGYEYPRVSLTSPISRRNGCDLRSKGLHEPTLATSAYASRAPPGTMRLNPQVRDLTCGPGRLAARRFSSATTEEKGFARFGRLRTRPLCRFQGCARLRRPLPLLVLR